MSKFKVVTLGCRTNQYEAQAFTEQLRQMGMVEAEHGADICVVNTCTVTQAADSSSRHAIRELLRENPQAQVMVTGCYAEAMPQEVAAIDPRVRVVANKDKEELLKWAFPGEELPEFKITRFEAHTRAFLKVQDGCNSFCTYCIIPYVRGRSRSRSREEIVREAEGLIAEGYKEIVLTGINVGDYDGGGGDTLANLVRALDALPGLHRLRISSIDPDEVDDDLLEAVVSGQHTCPSMHIVLQSGSNAILKRMNRKYSRQVFMATIDRLKKASPDFTFTTDIIVGFPGETALDFEDTLHVMREVHFAKVHMFPYSERKRTRAALFDGKVPQEVIKERKAALLKLDEEQAFELRQKFLGRKMKVLIENKGQGHTENFLPVMLSENLGQKNDIVDVWLKENTPLGFVGVLD